MPPHESNLEDNGTDRFGMRCFGTGEGTGSVRNQTGKLLNLLGDDRLLDRLVSLVRADLFRLALAIFLSLALAEHVAVRPVRGALPSVEELLLLGKVLGRNLRRGCKARVDDGADLVAHREGGVVHRPRVPQYQVARLGLHLVLRAAALLEPLDLLLVECVKVAVHVRREEALLLGQLLEELFKQRRRSLHHDQSTVLRSRVVQVQDTLHASQTLPVRTLVTVRPWLEGKVFAARQADVERVKADEQLVRTVELGERLDHGRLAASLPHETLVRSAVVEEHRLEALRQVRRLKCDTAREAGGSGCFDACARAAAWWSAVSSPTLWACKPSSLALCFELCRQDPDFACRPTVKGDPSVEQHGSTKSSLGKQQAGDGEISVEPPLSVLGRGERSPAVEARIGPLHHGKGPESRKAVEQGEPFLRNTPSSRMSEPKRVEAKTPLDRFEHAEHSWGGTPKALNPQQPTYKPLTADR
ncbi:hypothetical protein L1887_58149 [Cichorium endivia]|nr:hypothetical protein L1887_58149 [Cichorium endivia]